MATHYDANDPHQAMPDDILDPGDTDRHGRMYADHDKYEAEEQRKYDDHADEISEAEAAVVKDLNLKSDGWVGISL